MNRRQRARRALGLGLPRVELLEAKQLLAANVISGFVINDANHNGLFGPSEVPLPGSTIKLLNSKGTVIGASTVGADGSYSFNVDQSVSTAPTTLTQTITFPTATTPTVLSQATPQFNPALGTLTSVDVINAATVTDQIQTENQAAQPRTLVGTVSGSVTTTGPGVTGLVANTVDTVTFNASAFDGMLDFGGTSGHDFGLRSQSTTQSLTITDPATLASYIGTNNVSFVNTTNSLSGVVGSGNVVNAISTVAGGTVTVVYHYTPTNMIQPGNYIIVQAKEPVGFTNGLNSSNGTVLVNSPGSNMIPVTVTTTTTTYPGNDFGENAIPQPISSLSGSVFFDANNDGVREPSEFGIAHVTVNLTGTTTTGQPVSQIATTDDFGNYHFSGLLPGTYSLMEVQPPIFIKGKDHLGTLGGVKSKGLFSAIPVPALVNGVSYDFGELARAGCKLLGLTQFHIKPGHKLAPSQIGPEIRLYFPSLVPLITAGTGTVQPFHAHAATHAVVLSRRGRS